MEIGLKEVNRKQIIIDNINILPDREFSGKEEFLHYFESFSGTYSNENYNKVLNGFISLADDFEEADLEKRSFKFFLSEIKRLYVDLYTDSESLKNLSKFMDLYCIDYKDIWLKLEHSKV